MRAGRKADREPANLYEAVIALENYKHRKDPPPLKPSLNQEQQDTLNAAIRDFIKATMTALEGEKQT